MLLNMSILPLVASFTSALNCCITSVTSCLNCCSNAVKSAGVTMSAHCSARSAVAATGNAVVLCLASGFASVSTRDVAHRRSATMSNATVFHGTP